MVIVFPRFSEMKQGIAQALSRGCVQCNSNGSAVFSITDFYEQVKWAGHLSIGKSLADQPLFFGIDLLQCGQLADMGIQQKRQIL